MSLTPPSSFSHTPLTRPATLTPPSTDEEESPSVTFPGAKQIVALFKEIKSGYYEQRPWTKFQLQPDEYDEIERLLHADPDDSLWGFVDDKVRYDFDADQVIVRMPTPLHERFIKLVDKNIEKQLESFASSTTLPEPVVAFAEKLYSGGSPDIYFPTTTDNDTHEKHSGNLSKHSPDATYYHPKGHFPGVIVEVSYSQKRSDLPKLAKTYILGSDGDVQAVVGLDIEYKTPDQRRAGQHSRTALLSVWEPHWERNDGVLELSVVQTIKDQPFRDAHGNPVSSPNLVLPLSAFTIPRITKTIPGLDKSINIQISTTELCGYLNKAETRFQDEVNHLTLLGGMPPGSRKKA